jgi:hypothetical protein
MHKLQSLKKRQKLGAIAVAVMLITASGSAAQASTQQTGNANSLFGLLQQVQDLIGQIQSKPGEVLEQIKSAVGDAWNDIEGQIQQIAGDLGIIDPKEARKSIEERGKTVKMNPDLSTVVQNQGLETILINQGLAQTTLGKEGQRQSKKNLEGIIQTAENSQTMADEAASVTSEDMNAASNAQTAAQQSSQTGQNSNQTASQVRNQASQANSKTSSQDVLKLISAQTGGNAAILSNISGQLGGSAGQLGNISTQLANNSSQNSSLAKLQAAQVQISANQAASLETLKAQNAGMNSALAELNEALRGDRQSEMMQQQAEVNQMMKINKAGYRILK